MHAPSIVNSLKTYNRKTFFSDLGAGLTVGVVALPLAMAFAIACGSSEITPSTGLITAVVAGFLISLLGGSKFQIGGPTGAFVVLISAGADVNARDEEGETALDKAQDEGNRSAARVLRAAGAR